MLPVGQPTFSCTEVHTVAKGAFTVGQVGVGNEVLLGSDVGGKVALGMSVGGILVCVGGCVGDTGTTVSTGGGVVEDSSPNHRLTSGTTTKSAMHATIATSRPAIAMIWSRVHPFIG